VRRVLLSIFLGLLSPFVFILGASPFEVVGQNSIKEIVAGSLAVVLYLAICQFLVAPRGSRRLGAKWPTLAAMTAPLLVAVVLVASVEKPQVVLVQGLPMLSGCFGIFAGALLAGRVTLPMVSLRFCRRSLLTCAALLVAVAFVLAARVVPLTNKAGTFPDGTPGAMVPVSWAIVVLDILVGASLAFIAVRAGHARRPSPVVLGYLAFLAFVPASFLAVPAFAFRGHGPIMLTVSILMLLCSAAEFLVTGLVSTTALLLASEERA
jgi:hypothetical protein